MKQESAFKRNFETIIASLFFVILGGFWLYKIKTLPAGDSLLLNIGASYGIIALFGGILGLVYSKRWGGFKSSLGKALIFLSLGLIFTEFGQLSFSYYNIVKHIEIPYPSIADIGFFGAVPLYILGAYYMSKTLRLGNLFRNSNALKLILIALVPVAMVGATVWIYSHYYQETGVSTMATVLDFGYPIGQAIYVTIALLMLLRARAFFGGSMRNRILLLLLAFVLQYAADLNFLHQDLSGSWTSGGLSDAFYFLVYFAMVLSVLRFKQLPKMTGGSENA